MNTAYLDAEVDEELYMEILDGLENYIEFWKLNKVIYGLKQEK